MVSLADQAELWNPGPEIGSSARPGPVLIPLNCNQAPASEEATCDLTCVDPAQGYLQRPPGRAWLRWFLGRTRDLPLASADTERPKVAGIPAAGRAV